MPYKDTTGKLTVGVERNLTGFVAADRVESSALRRADRAIAGDWPHRHGEAVRRERQPVAVA
jgi:hypothetical protein